MNAKVKPSSLRLPYFELAPGPYKGFMAASESLKSATVGKKLVDLVFLRVSQINGCAFCVDMHWRDLIAEGMEPRVLNSVITWHENDFFDTRERAALKWAELLTRIGETHAPDEEFAAMKAVFSDTEIAELSFAAALMSAWNRMAISMRQPVPAKG